MYVCMCVGMYVCMYVHMYTVDTQSTGYVQCIHVRSLRVGNCTYATK